MTEPLHKLDDEPAEKTFYELEDEIDKDWRDGYTQLLTEMRETGVDTGPRLKQLIKDVDKRRRELILTEKNKYKELMLPKNNYYIGDPCYVIQGGDDYDRWHDFLDNTCQSGEVGSDYEHSFEYEGLRLFMHPTSHGDGVYEMKNLKTGEIDTRLSVDAGLIGCLPLRLIDKDKADEANEMGYVFSAPFGFRCSYENGVFTIANWRIDTN